MKKYEKKIRILIAVVTLCFSFFLFNKVSCEAKQDKVSVVISLQPQNFVGTLGDTAMFKVAAENARNYEWQYKGKGSNSWITFSWQDSYNTAEFKLTILNEGRLTNTYRCKITGEDGTAVYTDEVEIIQIKSPEIIRQPQNAEGKIGSTIVFSVEAANVKNYEWQYKEKGRNNWITFSWQDSYDTAEFKLPILNEGRLTNTYRCKITGEDGNAVYTDEVEIIQIKSPEIIRQPQNAEGKIGSTIVFSVEAANVKNYEWQYKEKGRNNWITFSWQDSYDTAEFKLPILNEGRLTNTYRCKITGEDGSIIYTQEVFIYSIKKDDFETPIL